MVPNVAQSTGHSSFCSLETGKRYLIELDDLNECVEPLSAFNLPWLPCSDYGDVTAILETVTDPERACTVIE
jgi:hypothetical protein